MGRYSNTRRHNSQQHTLTAPALMNVHTFAHMTVQPPPSSMLASAYLTRRPTHTENHRPDNPHAQATEARAANLSDSCQILLPHSLQVGRPQHTLPSTSTTIECTKLGAEISRVASCLEERGTPYLQIAAVHSTTFHHSCLLLPHKTLVTTTNTHART